LVNPGSDHRYSRCLDSDVTPQDKEDRQQSGIEFGSPHFAKREEIRQNEYLFESLLVKSSPISLQDCMDGIPAT
jgi:hypothetical protein